MTNESGCAAQAAYSPDPNSGAMHFSKLKPALRKARILDAGRIGAFSEQSPELP